jgi:hypothetical protein
MALPNVTGDIIAQGFNCNVRVGTNASDAQIIALVASFQATEDYGVQEANCIGLLGPASLDPQSYNCSITMQGYVPSKRVLSNTQQYADGGKVSLMEQMPTRAKFMDAASIQKIAYMDFYNKKSSTVLGSFSGVIITQDCISVEGNQYVRNNVQMRALSKDT